MTRASSGAFVTMGAPNGPTTGRSGYPTADSFDVDAFETRPPLGPPVHRDPSNGYPFNSNPLLNSKMRSSWRASSQSFSESVKGEEVSPLVPLADLSNSHKAAFESLRKQVISYSSRDPPFLGTLTSTLTFAFKSWR
jgi:hypothetical protein